MVEYQVILKGSDGKQYLISYEGLRQKLREFDTWEEKIGWNKVTRKLREDYDNLRDTLLNEVFIPKAKKAITQFLEEHPDIKTRNFYHKAWDSGIKYLAWYYAKGALEAEGTIISKSQGRGKNRTWRLT